MNRIIVSIVLALGIVFLTSCETPGPAPLAHAKMRDSATASRSSPIAQERPGLGTRWGETRVSRVDVTGFRRAQPSRPLVTTAIHYNDAEGIRAMIGATLTPRRSRPSLGSPAGNLLAVEIRDGSGRLLPGTAVGGRWFVIGEKGGRYSINVRNRSDVRIEVVLSVDGLDVLDGRAASFRKRGYVIAPHGTLRVEGFRQSTEAVAAFRFSSVRESYANQKHGETRNVGVIGIAAFNEYGTNPLDEEAQRRLKANPFPGSGFATPP